MFNSTAVPEPRLLVRLGDELQPSVAHRLAGIRRHVSTLDVPLGLHQWLNYVVRARTEAEAHGVICYTTEQTLEGKQRRAVE